MEQGFFFGIDTSNYMTSAACVTSAGEVFCAKRPLAVPLGEKGLRQSDALFCHTRDLPGVIEECLSSLRKEKGDLPLLGVGASSAPRRMEGSYMPCFLAGVNAAQSAATLSGVPFFSFSHQEGHIEAARFGAGLTTSCPYEEFLAFHLSGGTTELLLVKEDLHRYEVTLIADTLDLTCGQFLDRCGVKLGLPFPAGAHLEKLAQHSQKQFKIKIPQKETGINLSGFENQFDQQKEKGASPEDLAAFCFAVVEEAIRTLIRFAPKNLPLLFSGGVTSSIILQERLKNPLYFFAPIQFCGDNAIGIARMARKGVQNGSHDGNQRHTVK